MSRSRNLWCSENVYEETFDPGCLAKEGFGEAAVIELDLKVRVGVS